QSVEGVAEFNLFRFGADIAGARAANKEIESQEFTLQNTLLTAEAEAISALVDYILATRKIDVADRILLSRKDSLSVANRRYEKGQIPLEEVDKVSVDLDNATAQKRDAEASLAQASADLERLLGEERISTEWPWKDSLPKEVPRLIQESADLTRRPDWQISSKDWELAEQKAHEAFRDLFPRLDVKVSYGYFKTDLYGVGSSGPGWTAGLALTIPLYDRLVGYGRYRAQAHTQMAADAQFEGVRRLAKRDFDSARATLGISLDTALNREKTLGVARKIYQANRERFNRGILSANEFRIDQDRLTETETLVLHGWASAHNDFRRLCHAIGRRVAACLASFPAGPFSGL
ncbi:MAG: TolC family protein, partial [Deltaproteobacteria bacterium]|nr:TolC family protein [Deltaproteobacteria bacterium]